MTFIYELPGWPQFTWNSEALAGSLAAVRYKQGKHLGRMQALGFGLRSEASLSALTEEVVQSSAIEGEHLNPEEVRSSIARKLGLDVAGLPEPGREVEGIVAMMLDATRNVGEPLTAERIFGWHAALFPTGPRQVVSGPIGRERVHFQAPDAARVSDEMSRFLEWFGPFLQHVLRHRSPAKGVLPAPRSGPAR